jgi:hypothetical protein
VSGLQCLPEGCTTGIQQGGNFAGCLAVLDELAGVVNLSGGEFRLRAEFHPTPPRCLLSGFGAFDN